ncbi:DUF4288 domain-containing protein [Adhaeribacter radiodurans]|uniref:DUF4288 domain-containing protein n=1 Tax=Adhaeribacter radiodurans TaxID=2745197 RepID=A0A7L7L675_9BACT|nr:DUF4288 domain-containing protein [Adhaeribacter radiodurans]QMU27869.1 DUF4288 domain-containing protein [Adhaeribacter radiodurans]
MNINGLEDFGITVSDLVNQYADRKMDIRISFPYYPDLASLKPLTPKERKVVVSHYFRKQLKLVKSIYPTTHYQIVGSRNQPRGITGQLTGQQIAGLQSNQTIKWLNVEQVEGLPQIQPEAGPEPKACVLPLYYNIMGLFVATFDDLDTTTGIRLTEERMVLVKALNRGEAIQKAQVEFGRYSQAEILTSSYHFNKWKFLKVLDVYELGVSGIDPEGTEVYSIWKRRKLKESDYEQ